MSLGNIKAILNLSLHIEKKLSSLFTTLRHDLMQNLWSCYTTRGAARYPLKFMGESSFYDIVIITLSVIKR